MDQALLSESYTREAALGLGARTSVARSEVYSHNAATDARSPGNRRVR
jgi:hypothetical protein